MISDISRGTSFSPSFRTPQPSARFTSCRKLSKFHSLLHCPFGFGRRFRNRRKKVQIASSLGECALLPQTRSPLSVERVRSKGNCADAKQHVFNYYFFNIPAFILNKKKQPNCPRKVKGHFSCVCQDPHPVRTRGKIYDDQFGTGDGRLSKNKRTHTQTHTHRTFAYRLRRPLCPARLSGNAISDAYDY